MSKRYKFDRGAFIGHVNLIVNLENYYNIR